MSEVNEAQKSTKVIKNKSKAYGYNFTSLADIADVGVEIPKMRIAIVDGRDYIEWFDDAREDWNLGAQIIVPELKNSNKAQAYGAAVSYARRYTTLMARQLACDDDKGLEAQPPIPPAPKALPKLEKDEVDAFVDSLATIDDVDEIRKAYGKLVTGKTVSQFYKNQLSRFCKERIAQIEAEINQEDYNEEVLYG